MTRKELFEFEDFNWLPDSFRSGATNLIIVFHKMVGTNDVLTNLILKARVKTPFDQIVDMGSGSGGPMIQAVSELNEANPQNKINLILTDINPDSTVIKNINEKNNPNIRYQESPLNAGEMENAPKGLKSMIASFHHMSPTTAKKILSSAQNNKQPILIYELAKNNVPLPLWILFLPISLVILFVMSLIMTPFVRPLTFSQLFFTYIIPVIPIIYAWDGQASLKRTYTFKDIESLIENTGPDYTWEIKDALNTKGKAKGYYVLGYPAQ